MLELGASGRIIRRGGATRDGGPSAPVHRRTDEPNLGVPRGRMRRGGHAAAFTGHAVSFRRPRATSLAAPPPSRALRRASRARLDGRAPRKHLAAPCGPRCCRRSHAHLRRRQARRPRSPLRRRASALPARAAAAATRAITSSRGAARFADAPAPRSRVQPRGLRAPEARRSVLPASRGCGAPARRCGMPAFARCLPHRPC